jgi:TonB family protein
VKGRKQVSKTVKHCEVCQENFGDRFSYCPVCGETLRTVEVGGNQAYSASSNAVSQAPPPFVPREETVAAVAATAPLSQESVPAYVTPKPAAANGSATFKTNEPNLSIENFDTNPENYHDDGLFHLTILQAPKTHRRDFGTGAGFALGFMVVALTALLIWDIFNFPLDGIDSVGDDPLFAAAFLADNEPIQEEEEPPVEKNKDKGGGGGGGGKKDPKPVQEGVMPKMTREKQTIAPDVDRDIQPKFELKQQATLEGPEINKPSLERYGVVNGGKDASGGMGEGRGLGSGRGSGIGGGVGTGYGNGIGSGIGNGKGDGIGNGTGSGTGGDNDPPPVVAKKPEPVVSEPLKILSQPRPGYTEEARKNNVQGTVRVRVTFSASGQVTGVSAINSLPFGLTEKAIAAARQIQFIPAKRNGVPTSVQKTVEFRFTMY